MVPSCCVSPAPRVVHLHLGSELQWLLWQWHSEFTLCWTACQNCILLNVSRLCLWMSADPQLQCIFHIIASFSAPCSMVFLRHLSYIVLKLHAAVTSLHFSMHSSIQGLLVLVAWRLQQLLSHCILVCSDLCRCPMTILCWLHHHQ